MRLSKPRIAPLSESDWDQEQRDLMQPFVAGGRVFNVFGTLIHHPDLLRRWLVFANHVLGKSTIKVREREVLILRTAKLVNSEYEWGQHVVIAREAGLEDREIRAIGSNGDGLGELEKLLCDAADELISDKMLSADIWGKLNELFDTRQVMDIVFTVGQYTMLAMALNTFGVQLDEGLPRFET
tara:strand:+ start:312 stop:860 length:549 start_codon:yes stop_codon:yes gene_type:complete